MSELETETKTTRWFSADHHFGHHAIMGFAGRPWRDLAMMHKILTLRHNEVVAPGDEVWFLGDLTLGDRKSLLADIIPELNGDIHLVPGNHDYGVWPGKINEEYLKYYEDAGITIHNLQEFLTLKGDVNVQLSHLPYDPDPPNEQPDPFTDQRPIPLPEDYPWLLCGHVHTKWRYSGRQINVGVDIWDFYPVPEDRIIANIKHLEQRMACEEEGRE